jgi:hypothetical protein
VRRPPFLEKETLSVEDVVAGVIEEFQYHQRNSTHIPPVLLSERIIKVWEPYVAELVNRLPAEDVQYLLRKYHSLIVTKRIGTVYESGHPILERMRPCGNERPQISILPGQVRSMQLADDGRHITIRLQEPTFTKETEVNVPVVTAVTVLAQCSLPARNAEQKAHLLKDVGKAIFGNPLNLAVIGGLSLAFIYVSPPLGVMNFAHLLAGAAGPTGLFILGLSLAPSPVLQKGTPSNHREVAILVLFKIGLQPLVTCFFALVVFHITPLWASVTVLMAAMPIGANVAIFAQRYDVYALHISRAILASTLLSLLFLPIGIILLKQVLG